MARKRKAQAKYEYLKLDGTVETAEEVVCIPCRCVSGDGRPPAVGECACRCHDTARLWWSMRPWRGLTPSERLRQAKLFLEIADEP
jgi:hypothetical protein